MKKRMLNLTEYFDSSSPFPPPLTPLDGGGGGDSATSLKGFDDLTKLVQIITLEEALANISSKPRMVQEPTLNLVTISEMNRYRIVR